MRFLEGLTGWVLGVGVVGDFGGWIGVGIRGRVRLVGRVVRGHRSLGNRRGGESWLRAIRARLEEECPCPYPFWGLLKWEMWERRRRRERERERAEQLFLAGRLRLCLDSGTVKEIKLFLFFSFSLLAFSTFPLCP